MVQLIEIEVVEIYRKRKNFINFIERKKLLVLYIEDNEKFFIILIYRKIFKLYYTRFIFRVLFNIRI